MRIRMPGVTWLGLAAALLIGLAVWMPIRPGERGEVAWAGLPQQVRAFASMHVRDTSYWPPGSPGSSVEIYIQRPDHLRDRGQGSGSGPLNLIDRLMTCCRPQNRVVKCCQTRRIVGISGPDPVFGWTKSSNGCQEGNTRRPLTVLPETKGRGDRRNNNACGELFLRASSGGGIALHPAVGTNGINIYFDTALCKPLHRSQPVRQFHRSRSHDDPPSGVLGWRSNVARPLCAAGRGRMDVEEYLLGNRGYGATR